LKAIDERLDAISRKSGELGKASKDLASQTSSPEVVKAVKKQAADMGVKPSDAVEYAGTLTAVFGEKKMLEAMPAANKLRKMDVASEDISSLATAASAGNVNFPTAAAIFGQASKDSALAPQDFIKAAPAWMEYKDIRTGMAASTALAAGGVAPGSLMDRTKDLSLGLKMDSELKTKAEKKAGGANQYAALSELEQLAVMKSVIPDLNHDKKLSLEEVMKAGIGEQQKAQAIAIAANKYDVFKKENAAVAKAKPRVLDEIIATQERNSPDVADANRAEASAARAEYVSAYGPAAAAARANTKSKQALGHVYMAAGVPFGWDTETGAATFTGRAVMAAESGAQSLPNMQDRSLGLRMGFRVLKSGAEAVGDRLGITGDGDGQGGSSGNKGWVGLAETMANLVLALKENTDATRQNSRTEAPAAAHTGPNRNAGV
jgi:hypothetical protein